MMYSTMHSTKENSIMQWSLNDLAPICIAPHCPKYQTRHLLPHQEEIAKTIFQCNENYIYWQGGVGSAKTLLYGVIAVAYHIIIPMTRSILFRKDLALNYQTLWGYFKQSVKAACDQSIIPDNFQKMWSVKKAGEHTYCTFSNGSIARCGQTKNISEYLGPTYDLVIVSDAMENDNFGYIFRGEGTVGGLQSRLRGQVSTYYSLPDNTIKDMRRFLIESNPPPNINEIHTIFGREPGVNKFTGSDISYRHIQSNTLQNDHNPSTYVKEIEALHSSKADIQRIISGKTIPYYGGKRVIETFFNEIHVAQVSYSPDEILLVSIDPGTQHPAVTFSQIRNCAYNKPHYITFSEISNLFDLTTNDLVEKNDSPYLGILAHLSLFYSSLFDYDYYWQIRNRMPSDNLTPNQYQTLSQHFSRIRFCIDKSGNKRYSTAKDRQTDVSILYLEYGIQCKALSNLGLDQSLNRIRKLHSEICTCTLPRRIVNKDCQLLIDAYGGGYRYKKNKDGTHTDKPINDHIYEDVADADRYGIENFYFHPWKEEDTPPRDTQVTSDYPWSWMERR
jgi:hypothetical protein